MVDISAPARFSRFNGQVSDDGAKEHLEYRRIVRILEQHSEEEIIEIIEEASPRVLDKLRLICLGTECDCPTVWDRTGCICDENEENCECDVSRSLVRCPHMSAEPLFVLSPLALEILLQRLDPQWDVEPPIAEEPTQSLSKRALVNRYGNRFRNKRAIFNPEDEVQKRLEKAHLARQVHRGSNGAAIEGKLLVVHRCKDEWFKPVHSRIRRSVGWVEESIWAPGWVKDSQVSEWDHRQTQVVHAKRLLHAAVLNELSRKSVAQGFGGS